MFNPFKAALSTSVQLHNIIYKVQRVKENKSYFGPFYWEPVQCTTTGRILLHACISLVINLPTMSTVVLASSASLQPLEGDWGSHAGLWRPHSSGEQAMMDYQNRHSLHQLNVHRYACVVKPEKEKRVLNDSMLLLVSPMKMVRYA